MQPLTLFCLPFAGGTVYSYRKYEDTMPAYIKINCLEYPGRGRRINESLVPDINAIVHNLYRQISNGANPQNYAIYGHSMGGLVAYLLTHELIDNGHPPPRHLFITGTNAPSAPSRIGRNRHLLPKNEFIDEIKSLNGFPEEVLQNDELLEFVEPILRNDFKAIETYVYEKIKPLNVPFTVITGSRDEMDLEEVKLWQLESSHRVDFRQMDGDHFFIFKYYREITNIISDKLSDHKYINV